MTGAIITNGFICPQVDIQLGIEVTGSVAASPAVAGTLEPDENLLGTVDPAGAIQGDTTAEVVAGVVASSSNIQGEVGCD